MSITIQEQELLSDAGFVKVLNVYLDAKLSKLRDEMLAYVDYQIQHYIIDPRINNVLKTQLSAYVFNKQPPVMRGKERDAEAVPPGVTIKNTGTVKKIKHKPWYKYNTLDELTENKCRAKLGHTFSVTCKDSDVVLSPCLFCHVDRNVLRFIHLPSGNRITDDNGIVTDAKPLV